MCNNGGNVITPMVTREGQCQTGNPACKPTQGAGATTDVFMTGDPTGAIGPTYTSCNLSCEAQHGHSLGFAEGEFEGCEYLLRDWVVASRDSTTSFSSRAGAIQDQYLFVVGDVRSFNVSDEDNFFIGGPYTSQDQTAAQGKTVSAKIDRIRGPQP